jgi:hypothetical protein
MRKQILVSIVLLAFALVSTVSAFGEIKFPYDGKLKVGYLGSVTASYNDQFGIDQPAHMSLGFTKSPYTAPGTVFDAGRCIDGKEVVLYITAPDHRTYYSNVVGADGFNHADVSKVGEMYTVKFEDLPKTSKYYDNDLDDVIMNVTCIKDIIPIPEFPTMALPSALIVGLIGAVLFIQKSKEN